MTRGEDFQKKAKCKHGHCSPRSKGAWCDLHSKGNILKLQHMSPKPKCKCQKQVTFTAKQFQLERASIKKTLKKNEGSQNAWDKFLRPAVKAAAPLIGMAVSAKTKNPKIGERTSNSLNSFSRGKVLSVTDMHGNGLRLKVM